MSNCPQLLVERLSKSVPIFTITYVILSCRAQPECSEAELRRSRSIPTPSATAAGYPVCRRNDDCSEESFIQSNRNRGTITGPPLPHHRTCGSAYGGSAG